MLFVVVFVFIEISAGKLSSAFVSSYYASGNVNAVSPWPQRDDMDKTHSSLTNSEAVRNIHELIFSSKCP